MKNEAESLKRKLEEVNKQLPDAKTKRSRRKGYVDFKWRTLKIQKEEAKLEQEQTRIKQEKSKLAQEKTKMEQDRIEHKKDVKAAEDLVLI